MNNDDYWRARYVNFRYALSHDQVETPVHPGVQQLREEAEQERYNKARARLIREICRGYDVPREWFLWLAPGGHGKTRSGIGRHRYSCTSMRLPVSPPRCTPEFTATSRGSPPSGTRSACG